LRAVRPAAARADSERSVRQIAHAGDLPAAPDDEAQRRDFDERHAAKMAERSRLVGQTADVAFVRDVRVREPAVALALLERVEDAHGAGIRDDLDLIRRLPGLHRLRERASHHVEIAVARADAEPNRRPAPRRLGWPAASGQRRRQREEARDGTQATTSIAAHHPGSYQ